MLQTNLPIDPIVEILRLAYRRGLVLRQEQLQEQSKTVESGNLGGETLSTAEQDNQQRSSGDE